MNKSDITNEYKKLNFGDLKEALKTLTSRKSSEREYDHKLRVAILKAQIAQREITEIEKAEKTAAKRQINNAKYALGGIIHQLLLKKQLTAAELEAFVRAHDAETTAFERMKDSERQSIAMTTGITIAKNNTAAPAVTAVHHEASEQDVPIEYEEEKLTLEAAKEFFNLRWDADWAGWKYEIDGKHYSIDDLRFDETETVLERITAIYNN